MKLTTTLILLAVTSLLFLVSCNSKVKKSENYRSVNVAAAKGIIENSKDVVVLDVRTPKEVAAGQVEGAVNIDVMNSSFGDNIAELDKNKTYVIYCKSGGRSVTASKKMLAAGFTDVVNVEGGYTAWK